MSAQTTPFAALLVLELEDYERWKAAFDAFRPRRIDAGVVGHHINRSVDGPTRVAVYLPATDQKKLTDFFAGDEIRAAMRSAGVKGTPEIKIMRPTSVDANLGEALAGLIVVHRVADYAKWRAVYDAFDDTRRQLGISGHAVNQLANDPSTVLVYHQAADVETLQRFVETPELREAMQSAGVEGPPQISFWRSQAAVMY